MVDELARRLVNGQMEHVSRTIDFWSKKRYRLHEQLLSFLFKEMATNSNKTMSLRCSHLGKGFNFRGLCGDKL